ncbi:hypothetical protein [Microbacterium sediminis]|uniref:Uncharacterized protein n=1 Tax=Microbacterium sediminis TaxID=904291 RepID=A0A1B9NB92_9MICO|nr:hypothetical protein [Microbacterium sediminis]OCG73881.1 hypothetical protein A7J15_06590 [Microbacterium sediminis]QBR74628.1 hypothetical protein E3O41_09630 [Microbacterium sediminis]
MTDREHIKKPLDHLPPKEEREGDEIDEPDYPGSDDTEGGSRVSPDTAAEPGEPARHGVAKLRPQS